MKVRIGFGLGTRGTMHDGDLAVIADELERLGFDSLWLSERVTGDAPDPVVGLSFVAGRTQKLKLGTSVMVLPGRNPVLVAKELATLDRLSGGRLLPAFGLGAVDPLEHQAFGVARQERAAWFDEALPLIRRLWTEDAVTHQGERFSLEALTVRPRPLQDPPDVWLGGIAPSELRRVGRLADGWLPSFLGPEEAAHGRVAIKESAEAAGREIDEEHWGALVLYTSGAPLPDRLAKLMAARRPGIDPADLVPVGVDGLRATLERWLTEGFSKFVLLPIVEPASWPDELGTIATELLPLQQ